MARTVASAFRKFASRIEPTDAQKQDAETKVGGVRACLKERWVVDTTFLTGSYRRHTMIGPPKDIDLVVILNYDEHGEDYCDPDDADELVLERFHRDLKRSYPNTPIRKDRPAVNLDFSTVGFDVVPGFRRSGGGFLVPDPLREGWLPTNPVVHRRRTAALDAATDGRFVRVAKMLKEWNLVNFDRLTGFHLEMALVEAWPEGEDGAPAQFSNSAEALAALFPALLAPLGDSLDDPAGLSGDIDDYLSADHRELTLRCVERDAEAAAIARRHQAREDHERAIRKWGEIFGQRFPAFS